MSKFGVQGINNVLYAYLVFSVVVIKSCCGVLVVILMSLLFGVFSRRSLVKETAATSGKFRQCVV